MFLHQGIFYFQAMEQEQLQAIRHSAAHMLAAAVLQLYPGTKLGIGPAIDDGFYYDFEFPQGVVISDKELPKIQNQMKKIIKGSHEFVGREVSAEQAKAEHEDQPFKCELIDDFSQDGKTLTIYESGPFKDLCKGGHVENTKEIPVDGLKLHAVAGAYWKGSEHNPMLTRIYGFLFETKDQLDAHLHMLEEAKRRDHRKLGKELDLFFIDEVIGKGLIMWLPKGTIVRDEIERFAEEKEKEYGYKKVYTPHMAKEQLYLTSGHLPYYKEDMYPAMEMDDGTYYLRAMNCPHHHIVYKHHLHSYRELPLRIAEYGTVYRNERSGTLAGLLRVRGLTMNDAHIYCRKDQIKDEFKQVMTMTMEYFNTFGLENYWFRLSKWDPARKEKYIDQPENWEFSESVLREVLTEMDVPFVEVEDEAAFYGPKVDVQFKSVIGREETMSTIQLDFLAKERFGLVYTDQEGKENNEVFVIHRAPLSTHERFTAFLIEHFAGVFPVWMSPVQVAILPVSTDKHLDGATALAKEFEAVGVRVIVDDAVESVGKKIRNAAKQKTPYVLVVGDNELGGDELMIRIRGQEDQVSMKRADFIEQVQKEVAQRIA